MARRLISVSGSHFVAALAAAALFAGCSEGSDDEGAVGSAGAGSSAVATGGSAGNSGTEAGGAAGSTTAGEDMVMIAEFDADHEGFQPETWEWDGEGAEPLVSTIEWVNDQGTPDMGAIKVTVPTDAYNQSGMIQLNFSNSAPLDLTGRELFISYKWDSGFNSEDQFPAGVQFFVKTGDEWRWGAAPWKNLGIQGMWDEHTLRLDPDYVEAPDGPVDPSQIMAIGIAFNTGGGPQSGEEAALPTEGVFYVDSLGHRPAE